MADYPPLDEARARLAEVEADRDRAQGGWDGCKAHRKDLQARVDTLTGALEAIEKAHSIAHAWVLASTALATIKGREDAEPPIRRAHATRPDNVGQNWSGDRDAREDA